MRPHKAGDIGWVIFRHGVNYSEEYGLNESYEALVANIAADFINNFDPEKERCWIAEIEGERVGSVFLVKGEDQTTARLRMLIVEPKARGLGLGNRLVAECVGFARRVRYEKIELWTLNFLDAARHIYEKAGFRLVKTENIHSFGRDLISETWELFLSKQSRSQKVV